MYNDVLLKAVFKRYIIPARLPLFTINMLLAGHYLGAEAMNVLTLLLPIYLLFNILGTWINVGAFTQVMRAVSEDRPQDARSFSTLAIVWTAAASLVVSLLLLSMWQPFLSLLGVTAQLKSAADSYGRILAVGGIFIAFFQYPFQFLKLAGLQRVNIPLFIAVSILDAALGWLLLEFLGMQLAGLALAAIVALALIGLGGFIVLRRAHRQHLLGRIQNFTASSRLIFSSGSALALSKAYELVQITCLNSFIFYLLGADGLVIFAVVLSLLHISGILFSLVVQPVTPLAGYYYGQRDRLNLVAVLKLSLQKACLFGALPTVTLLFFHEQVACLSGVPDELLGMAGAALLYLAAAFIPMGLNVVLMAYYATTGKYWLANGIAIVRSIVLMGAYMLLAELQMFNIWANYAVVEWLTFCMILLLCRKVGRGQNGLERIALFRPDEAVLAEYTFVFRVKELDMAAQCRRLQDFCRQNGIDEAAAQKLELFITAVSSELRRLSELKLLEMQADIRLTVSSDKAAVRLCYLGAAFSLAARQELEALLSQTACLAFKRAMGFWQIYLTVQRNQSC